MWLLDSNDEGLLKNNNMYYCDVVRGTKDLVGPFSGISKLDSQYKFNTLEKWKVRTTITVFIESWRRHWIRSKEFRQVESQL